MKQLKKLYVGHKCEAQSYHSIRVIFTRGIKPGGIQITMTNSTCVSVNTMKNGHDT